MARITLTVPKLAQEMSDCCWHTSAMMIWQYSQGQTGRQGPMNTLGKTYTDNKGLSPQAFITLAGTVGMLALPLQAIWNSGDLALALRMRGPLWCAGYWFGPGHVVVLTGVDGDTIQFNDPDGGVAKTGALNWFNTKLANGLNGCMMAKNAAAY
jgi:ABC-type bacteriocin/lantibiotic exporter with double-glycine peptidase domain